ncbi:hypothetical protein FQA39_LY00867 [Lamprigera yunnana]|nr:hypothetical protein FQA39_LY00867 [Lamprigera yunnana]
MCDTSTSHNAQTLQRHVLSEDARTNQLDNNVLFCYISLQSYRQRFGHSYAGNWSIENHRTADWVAGIPEPLQLTPEAEMGPELTYTELMPVVNTENDKTEILFSNVKRETDTVDFPGIHQETEPVAYSPGNHKTDEERDSNNFEVPRNNKTESTPFTENQETENRDDECLATPAPEKLPKKIDTDLRTMILKQKRFLLLPRAAVPNVLATAYHLKVFEGCGVPPPPGGLD